jgi:hypothetical protein
VRAKQRTQSQINWGIERAWKLISEGVTVEEAMRRTLTSPKQLYPIPRHERLIRADLAKQLYNIEHKFWKRLRMDKVNHPEDFK